MQRMRIHRIVRDSLHDGNEMPADSSFCAAVGECQGEYAAD